jgi:hypothetical protein
MVTTRSGRSKLGCLVSILLLVTVVYFGANVGEVFWRYYRFQDAMKQEARFAERSDDEGIQRRLASFADSLGLPEEASRVNVSRSASQIVISAEWSEHVELPLMAREFRFAPRVESAR